MRQANRIGWPAGPFEDAAGLGRQELLFRTPHDGQAVLVIFQKL
jgi:hypothetical protein